MASQMTFKLTQKFQQWTYLFENIVVTHRSILNTDLRPNRQLMPVFSFPGNRRDTVRKCVTALNHRSHAESVASLTHLGQNCSRIGGGRLRGYKMTTAVETLIGQMILSQRFWMRAADHCRKLTTSSSATSKFGVGSHEDERTASARNIDSGKDWALRLANENGYLSWCRNTYLATVVALALIEEGKTAFAEQAAEGALVVAALNLTWGTYQYIYNMVQLRPQTGMSVVGAGACASLALLHLTLWFMVCATFLGITADTDLKGREDERERQSQEQ